MCHFGLFFDHFGLDSVSLWDLMTLSLSWSCLHLPDNNSAMWGQWIEMDRWHPDGVWRGFGHGFWWVLIDFDHILMWIYVWMMIQRPMTRHDGLHACLRITLQPIRVMSYIMIHKTRRIVVLDSGIRSLERRSQQGCRVLSHDQCDLNLGVWDQYLWFLEVWHHFDGFRWISMDFDVMVSGCQIDEMTRWDQIWVLYVTEDELATLRDEVISPNHYILEAAYQDRSW